MQPNITRLKFSILFSLVSFVGFSQIQDQHQRYQSKIEIEENDTDMRIKYGKEFELVNEALIGDSSILDSLNPLTLEHYRQDSEDYILEYRSLNNIEILIYSRERIRRKTSTLNETE